MNNLLKINNLIVSFENPKGELTAVKGVSLQLDKGETLALVGGHQAHNVVVFA